MHAPTGALRETSPALTFPFGCRFFFFLFAASLRLLFSDSRSGLRCSPSPHDSHASPSLACDALLLLLFMHALLAMQQTRAPLLCMQVHTTGSPLIPRKVTVLMTLMLRLNQERNTHSFSCKLTRVTVTIQCKIKPTTAAQGGR